MTRIRFSLSLLASIYFSLSFAQDASEYVIMKNPKDGTCKAYAVSNKNIKAKRYELQDIKNPVFIAVEKKIDSLKTLMNSSTVELNTKESTINGKNAELKKNCYETQIKQYLEIAKQQLETVVSQPDTKNWDAINLAKENMDKTSIVFEQNTKGKYPLAIEQANSNLTKIKELLKADDNSNKEISKNLKELDDLKSTITKQKNAASKEIKELERKINGSGRMGYDPELIPETIRDYVPVADIDRSIVIVETVNAGNELEGNFLDYDNKYSQERYYLMKVDYLQFKKNELVPKEIFESTIQNGIKRNEVSQFVGNYDYLNNSNDNYLFKGATDGKLYYTDDNILGKCAVEKQLYVAVKFVKDKGGDLFVKDDMMCVSLNGSECALTDVVKESLLKKDATIISKMASSVKQHKTYKDQASVLASKMMKYMNSYYAHTITSTDLAAWKQATQQCTDLISKMGSLPYADLQEYYTQCRAENNEGIKFADIIDTNTTSRQLLGL